MHLLNVARSLKIQSQVPNSFWGDCILTVAHLINITPSKLLDFKSPYEVLFQKPPDYDNLKIFGCLCYMTNITVPKDKLASRAVPCLFLSWLSFW